MIWLTWQGHIASGNIDASGLIYTGNTDKQNLSASTKLNYEFGKFINTLELSARSSEDEQVRTSEKYIVDNQTKYKITPDLYSYLELEYVNDRFSGFQYRTSELLGVGYKFINWDHFTLAGEAGAGGRQSKTTDDVTTSTALGKVGLNTWWQITDDLKFENKTTSSYGSDALITISDSSLKTTIIESLYLKVGYNVQHIDDVPADRKHIDTLTTVGIGYEF